MNFNNFIGQEELVNNLKIFLYAAAKLNKMPDHILLSGPPGLGKTTLCNCIVSYYSYYIGNNYGNETFQLKSAAPQIKDTKTLLSYLKTMATVPSCFLFIDEIHALKRKESEILLPFMEEGIFYDPDTHTKIEAKNTTIIGATTNPGFLIKPLRDRFGIKVSLQLYDEESLSIIIGNTLTKLIIELSEFSDTEVTMDSTAIQQLAKRSRGTPRIAKHLSKRIIDYVIAYIPNSDLYTVDEAFVIECMNKLKIDSKGLDELSNKYLKYLYYSPAKSASMSTLCSMLGEQKDTIEEIIEPYLLHINFVEKTSRGRKLTDKGEKHYLNKNKE